MALSVTGIQSTTFSNRVEGTSDVPQDKYLLSEMDGGITSDTVPLTLDGVVKSVRAVRCNAAGTIYTCPVGRTTFVPETVAAGEMVIGWINGIGASTTISADNIVLYF